VAAVNRNVGKRDAPSPCRSIWDKPPKKIPRGRVPEQIGRYKYPEADTSRRISWMIK